VDVDPKAVAYAASRYSAPNVEFAVMDLAALALEDASFDAVCAFEAIEHVSDPEAVLGEVARVLRPDGTVVVSTPRAEVTTNRPENPYHSVEYAPADFERLLGGFFEEVVLYGQRRLQTRRHRLAQRLDVLGLRRRLRPARATATLLGTRPTAQATLDDVVIEQATLDRASEIVAVCSGPRRP
ncbi:MAG TPA: class I SAM-dependent methyltransferase, partial [Gaiellaceae bacterium]|nr:class I SAM-dependent methyltransferase [Gaiellaceae bacterium]